MTPVERVKRAAKKRGGKQIRVVRHTEVELAIAWMRDEVGIRELSLVTSKVSCADYAMVARALKQAYKLGHLTVTVPWPIDAK